MTEFKLYCFAESGNAYTVALMLELCGQKWSPAWVDFFNGETRSEAYRRDINEMGEVPVLVHGAKKLTQSGAILTYLSEMTGKFGATSDDERYEVLRWILFNNHKFTSYIATLRFLLRFAETGETAVTEFLRGRATTALQLVDKHLADQAYIIGDRFTIADISMCGYMFYDGELGVDTRPYLNIAAWLERIKAQPGWKGPYELLPKGSV